MSPERKAREVADRIIACAREWGGEGAVSLHEPYFGGREKAYLSDCIESGFVSSVGQYVNDFEERLAEYTGAARAVVTVNGTAALHVALLLAEVQPGDEVIVPDLSFVATANAVAHCGAVPHFAEIQASTLGLDPAALGRHLSAIAEPRDGRIVNRDTGRRISAVVAMHTFGHPADLAGLVGVCERWGIPLVEDAAESLGSLYGDRHTGRYGMLAALSFNGNKIVTTGGGGAILTEDPELADLAKHITTTAKVAHRWEYAHDRVAYNYRMPNVNAALGCAQLEQLPEFVEAKRALAEKYRVAFEGVDGAELVVEPRGTRSNYWLNAIRLDHDTAPHRDEILAWCHDESVLARPAWRRLSTLPMYMDSPRMVLDTSRDMEARIINLPSSYVLALRAGESG